MAANLQARHAGVNLPTLSGGSCSVEAQTPSPRRKPRPGSARCSAIPTTAMAPPAKRWRPARGVELIAPAGRLGKDAFAVDVAAGTATCPAGHTVTHRRMARRNPAAPRQFSFAAHCPGCPLRAQCSGSPRGRCCPSGRTRRFFSRRGPPAPPSSATGIAAGPGSSARPRRSSTARPSCPGAGWPRPKRGSAQGRHPQPEPHRSPRLLTTG